MCLLCSWPPASTGCPQALQGRLSPSLGLPWGAQCCDGLTYSTCSTLYSRVVSRGVKCCYSYDYAPVGIWHMIKVYCHLQIYLFPPFLPSSFYPSLLPSLPSFFPPSFPPSSPPLPPQRTKGQRYRFSLLLQEIRNAETHEYAAVILAFINCIIAGSPDLSQRVALRNEFIGNFTYFLQKNFVSNVVCTCKFLDESLYLALVLVLYIIWASLTVILSSRMSRFLS